MALIRNHCVVPGCESGDDENELRSYHTIPYLQLEAEKVWKGNLNIAKTRRGARICSRHFAAEDIYKYNGKTRLRSGAVPLKHNPPNTLSSEELSSVDDCRDNFELLNEKIQQLAPKRKNTSSKIEDVPSPKKPKLPCKLPLVKIIPPAKPPRLSCIVPNCDVNNPNWTTRTHLNIGSSASMRSKWEDILNLRYIPPGARVCSLHFEPRTTQLTCIVPKCQEINKNVKSGWYLKIGSSAEMREKWQKILKLGNLPADVNVCSLHFDDEDLEELMDGTTTVKNYEGLEVKDIPIKPESNDKPSSSNTRSKSQDFLQPKHMPTKSVFMQDNQSSDSDDNEPLLSKWSLSEVQKDGSIVSRQEARRRLKLREKLIGTSTKIKEKQVEKEKTKNDDADIEMDLTQKIQPSRSKIEKMPMKMMLDQDTLKKLENQIKKVGPNLQNTLKIINLANQKRKPLVLGDCALKLKRNEGKFNDELVSNKKEQTFTSFKTDSSSNTQPSEVGLLTTEKQWWQKINCLRKREEILQNHIKALNKELAEEKKIVADFKLLTNIVNKIIKQQKALKNLLQDVESGKGMPHQASDGRAQTSTASESPAEFLIGSDGPAQTSIASESPSESLIASDGPAQTLLAGDGPTQTLIASDGPAQTSIASESPSESLIASDGPAQTLLAGDGPAPTLIASDGPAQTSIASESPSESLIASDGPAQTLLAGDGPAQTLIASDGPAQTLTASDGPVQAQISGDGVEQREIKIEDPELILTDDVNLESVETENEGEYVVEHSRTMALAKEMNEKLDKLIEWVFLRNKRSANPPPEDYRKAKISSQSEKEAFRNVICEKQKKIKSLELENEQLYKANVDMVGKLCDIQNQMMEIREENVSLFDELAQLKIQLKQTGKKLFVDPIKVEVIKEEVSLIQ